MEHIKCLRCGRRLKNEQSKELGYGEVCWKKFQFGNKSYNLLGISDNAVCDTALHEGAGTEERGTDKPDNTAGTK